MTTMQIDRAVVEQALEALEDAKALLNNKDRTTTMWFADEITALRAALAQAEPLNLADSAVRKRLATQWGYVHEAQQAEPDHETRAELAEQQVVQLAEERDHYRNLWQKAQQDEPVAALTAQRSALLEALKLARPYISVRTMAGYHAEVKADAAIKAVEETK